MKWRNIILTSAVLLLFLSLIACVPISISSIQTPEVTKQVSSQSGETYCILSPDGAGFSSRGGNLSDSPSPTTESSMAGEGSGETLHGELVWSTLQDELRQRSAEPATIEQARAVMDAPVVVLVPDEFSFVDSPRVERQELWTVPNHGDVLLVALDIKDFKVDDATKLITSTLASYQMGGALTLTDGVSISLPKASNFVIHMSWIEVPCGALPTSKQAYLDMLCNTVNDAGDKALSSLEAFQEMKKEVSGMTFKGLCASGSPTEPAHIADETFNEFAADPTVGQMILAGTYESYTLPARIENDQSQPLFQTLNCTGQNVSPDLPCPGNAGTSSDNSKLTVINVAAAGNSDLPYPFAPAMFDSVLSVSASDAVSTVVTISGTVMITDSLDPILLPIYSNWGEVAAPGQHPDGHHMGTSFAAPRVSIWAALYLLYGGKSPCADDKDVIPVLGYKGPIQNRSQLRNMKLDASIRQYCPDSPYQ